MSAPGTIGLKDVSKADKSRRKRDLVNGAVFDLRAALKNPSEDAPYISNAIRLLTLALGEDA